MKLNKLQIQSPRKCSQCRHYSDEPNELLLNPFGEYCRNALVVGQANTSEITAKSVAVEIHFARVYYCENGEFFEENNANHSKN